MQVIFRGDPAELASGRGLSRTRIDMWGVHFVMGAPVDVSHLDPKQQAKLRSNGHFEVVEDVAAPPVDADEAAEAAAHAERAKAKAEAKRNAAKAKAEA